MSFGVKVPSLTFTLEQWQRYNDEIQTNFRDMPASYYALSLAAEVGELSNKLCRLWRLHGHALLPQIGLHPRSIELPRDALGNEIRSELADILVFHVALCSKLGVDIQDEFYKVYVDKIIPRLIEGKHYTHQTRDVHTE